MRSLAFVFCFIASVANAQIIGDGMGAAYGGWKAGAPAGYTGPGNVVSGALFSLSCTRSYNAAYATGSNPACNIRRASDSTQSDIVFLTNGTFDVASYNTFVGTDATASCTLSGTAASCSGASATIHVGDPVTGAGITNPCVVTVTNGSTTATMSLAGTSTTCGTVGGAVTFTFQVAGLITQIYDATGNTRHATQATAGNQPQLLPLCLNSGTIPCIWFNGSTQRLLTASIASGAQPASVSMVVERRGNTGALNDVISNSAFNAGLNSTANTAYLFCGSVVTASGATDNAPHSLQFVCNGASSIINVDGTDNTVSAGANAIGTFVYGYGQNGNVAGVHLFAGYSGEATVWGSLATSVGNRSSLHTNVAAFYGTP